MRLLPPAHALRARRRHNRRHARPAARQRRAIVRHRVLVRIDPRARERAALRMRAHPRPASAIREKGVVEPLRLQPRLCGACGGGEGGGDEGVRAVRDARNGRAFFAGGAGERACAGIGVEGVGVVAWGRVAEEELGVDVVFEDVARGARFVGVALAGAGEAAGDCYAARQ